MSKGVSRRSNVPVLEAGRTKTEDKTRCVA